MRKKNLSCISKSISSFISSDNLFLRYLFSCLKSWNSCSTHSLISYNDLAYLSNARPLPTEYRDTLLENTFEDNFRGWENRHFGEVGFLLKFGISDRFWWLMKITSRAEYPTMKLSWEIWIYGRSILEFCIIKRKGNKLERQEYG